MTTASLQSGTLTVRQAARLFHVSERLIYMARCVHRLRPDLDAFVEAGKLSVHRALQIAVDRPMPTKYDKLVKAWNAASHDDRMPLLLRAGVFESKEQEQ